MSRLVWFTVLSVLLPLALFPTLHGLTPWESMWVLSITIFVSLKLLTVCCSLDIPAPPFRRLGYVILWPGLDARNFVAGRSHTTTTDHEWRESIASLLIAPVLLIAAVCPISEHLPAVRGWFIILGLVSFFHFGVCGLLSCFWRSRGVDAKPLMRSPYLATSLREFWGKRWNTAYRDVSHTFCFLPVASRFGVPAAIGVTFFLSGIIHEIVISLPAGAGYGLPTLYFLIQGLGCGLEHAVCQGLRSSHLRRALTLAWVLLPSPLLFHDAFLSLVVLPAFQPVRSEVFMLNNTTLILIGAALHIPIIGVALSVPSQLAWRQELSSLAPLHRQMHWLYGIHIFLCLIVFMLLSFCNATELASGTPLARSLCAFVAIFWSLRLCAQPMLSVSPFLDSRLKRLGYHALTANFVSLVLLYAFVAAS